MAMAQMVVANTGVRASAARPAGSSRVSRSTVGRRSSGPLPRRTSRQPARRQGVAVMAQMEEVDPVTGEILASAARAPAASESLTAGGLTWAYRKGETDEAAAVGVDCPPILLLHGIGSSSYSYRVTLELLAGAGYEAYAPDFIGHGSSSKPSPSSFAYDGAAYKAALGDFMQAAPFSKPVVLVVQGFILAQYALLWAAENPDMVEKLVILNTPLSPKTKLPPYLAPYKNPISFMRPKGAFAADMHNAGGSAYIMQYKDAEVYNAPYVEDQGANEALVATLDKCDLKELVSTVDELYESWRTDTLVLFGGSDSYITQQSAFDFLETKRTCIKIQTFEAKVGHMPQEDYPEILVKKLVGYLSGQEQKAVSPGTRIPGNFTDSKSA
eukprot:jgi/Tetstr1/461599/TSEL_006700.t1